MGFSRATSRVLTLRRRNDYPRQRLDIDDLTQITDIQCALVASADGLLLAKTANLAQDTTERIAAAGAALWSAFTALGGQLEVGGIMHVTTAFEKAVLFAMSVGTSSLFVLGREGCNSLIITREMAKKAKVWQKHLSADPRTEVSYEFDSSAFDTTPMRPFTVTGGRVDPTRNTIGVDTLLMVPDPPKPLPTSATRQQRALYDICQGLMSLVEAAAHLGLPVSTVRVVASDLVDSGHLIARVAPDAGPSIDLLEAVLRGLRAL